jgi:hypothetical protein
MQNGEGLRVFHRSFTTLPGAGHVRIAGGPVSRPTSQGEQ